MYTPTHTLTAQLNVFIGTQCTKILLFPETTLVISALFILIKYPEIRCSSIIFWSMYVTTSPPYTRNIFNWMPCKTKENTSKEIYKRCPSVANSQFVYTKYSQITFCILPTSTLRGRT